MALEEDVDIDQRFQARVDAEQQGQSGTFLQVVDGAGDVDDRQQDVGFQFGLADLGICRARVGFELRHRTFRQGLRICREARGHIDAQSLQFPFGNPAGARAGVIQFQTGNPPRRMTRGLRKRFCGIGFHPFIGAGGNLQVPASKFFSVTPNPACAAGASPAIYTPAHASAVNHAT